MKKTIAFILAIVVFLLLTMTYAHSEGISSEILQIPTVSERQPTTEDVPPDLPTIEDPPEILQSVSNYVVNLSNLSQFSLVALNNLTINGHVRGSIWVGGTLSGEGRYVDDGSINHENAGTSYIYNNNSTVQFKGRTSEQSVDAFSYLTKEAVSATSQYWTDLITNIGYNNTWVYIAPTNGHVDLQTWDYQCPGTDESQSTFEKIYWTDATTVTVGGLAGHLIAPNATVTIVSCNHCGSIVAKNITTNAETHINYWNPSDPPEKEDEPTITPEPVDLTVNKTLIGSLWHIRCDYMDGITFKAGGGFWRRDWIKNPDGYTSKEGHRSNKCGNVDNWVIWVDKDGVPFRMDEIKSGATGGTLPTIIYEPRYPMTAEEILAMENGDPNLIWKYAQNFIDLKEWDTIQIGERLYWTTSNGNQVWYHTGIPYKVESPTYTLYIDGEAYDLIANEGSVTLNDLEQGIHTISEKISPDTHIGAILVNGVPVDITTTSFEIDEDTVIEWVNEYTTPEPKPSPKPPEPPVVTTPPPEESESPTVSPSPTPTSPPETTTSAPPTESPTPSPTPISYCDFGIRKIITNPSEDAIFFFEVTSPLLNEPMYIEIYVDPTVGYGIYRIEEVPAGRYTVKEIDIPAEYRLVSEEELTQYIAGTEQEFVFENELITVTPTPTPTTIVVELPEVPPDEPQPKIPHNIWKLLHIEDYETALGGELLINHVGDCFD